MYGQSVYTVLYLHVLRLRYSSSSPKFTICQKTIIQQEYNTTNVLAATCNRHAPWLIDQVASTMRCLVAVILLPAATTAAHNRRAP
jgi:hypothetical protein